MHWKRLVLLLSVFVDNFVAGSTVEPCQCLLYRLLHKFLHPRKLVKHVLHNILRVFNAAGAGTDKLKKPVAVGVKSIRNSMVRHFSPAR
jgi:hypothetical protein